MLPAVEVRASRTNGQPHRPRSPHVRQTAPGHVTGWPSGYDRGNVGGLSVCTIYCVRMNWLSGQTRDWWRALSVTRKSKASGAAGLQASQVWLRADHDLRQPVQSLAMLAHTLSADCTEQERIETAAKITLVTDSLRDMLDTLSVLARLASGQQAPEARQGSAAALADRVVAELDPVASRLRIAVGRTGVQGQILADLALLERCVRGLVLFALKFGTGREIRIDCRQLKAQVSIDVVYEGPDPAAFIPRQAFVDLSPMLVSPPRVLQEIGLAFIAALSVTLGVAFSHGTARSGRRRLTLRLARAA